MEHLHKTILVTGATGKQGGSVVKHLLANGWNVRALTRNPQKSEARALAAQGVEVVQGSFDDRASLDRALDGVYAAYSVQQVWEVGPARETEQGKAFADAAKAANVKHFVYSSVCNADQNTGIPHFESKWEVEKYIKSLELPATIVRPVFFMENFLAPDSKRRINDGSLSFSLHRQNKLQVIAVDDIGWFVAKAFAEPESYIGKALDIAGDEVSGEQIAMAFSQKLGHSVTYVELPTDQLRQVNMDRAIMFDWFNTVGYSADINALRKVYPQLKTFAKWIEKVDVNLKQAA
ncbi:NmrA/HSCARG family protein [candidate division KSB1 bacterium]|nr:NmrA/HSCARG family protein [candidate division KSB1 bacterium]